MATHAVDAEPALADDLRTLHAMRWPPLGQSIRSGTQTHGHLRDRGEASLQALFRRLDAAIADHLARLPGSDPAHPLLRHIGRPVRIAAAWSIRMTGAGHHVSHVHPAGILSSACHVAVPDTRDGNAGEGFLELGRPPRDIPLPLDPLAVVRPVPGRMVLFPSFLYHGTRPVRRGERLTVAFDVAPAR